jgi:hypothetical protein
VAVWKLKVVSRPWGSQPGQFKAASTGNKQAKTKIEEKPTPRQKILFQSFILKISPQPYLVTVENRTITSAYILSKIRHQKFSTGHQNKGLKTTTSAYWQRMHICIHHVFLRTKENTTAKLKAQCNKVLTHQKTNSSDGILTKKCETGGTWQSKISQRKIRQHFKKIQNFGKVSTLLGPVKHG